MDTELKIGDTVECVDIINTNPYDVLVLGKHYKVVGFNGTYDVLLEGIKPSWRKSRFKKVTDTTAKDTQVGGNHYAKLAIQPYEYITANNIGMIEGNVIKYVTRWKDKGGVEDLKKAVHSLQWLIEYTEKQGVR